MLIYPSSLLLHHRARIPGLTSHEKCVVARQGETNVNLRCTLITLLTGVPLALYLIPNYGIIGLIFTILNAVRKMNITYCVPDIAQLASRYLHERGIRVWK